MRPSDEQGPRWSTAQDIQLAMRDWTRIDLVLFLAGPRRDVGAVALAMGMKTHSLIGHHLRTLERARLVECEKVGSEHFYTLTPRCRVTLMQAHVCIEARADDGNRWCIELLRSTAVARLLQDGIHDLETSQPTLFDRPTPVLPDGRVPVDSGRTRSNGHRAIGPG